MADASIIHKVRTPVIFRSRSNVLFVEIDLLENPEVLEYSLKFKTVIAHNGDYKLSDSTIETIANSDIKLFGSNLKL